MIYFSKKIILFLILFLSVNFTVNAQTFNLDASKLVPTVEVYLSPSQSSFSEGATFEVPVIINTKGLNINSSEIRISYDKEKLNIISSSNGVSIIGVWVEPPKYDNSRGTASYVGVIPNGITTNSGVVGTITFKAIKSGRAIVSIGQNSKVLLNDGLGTETIIDLKRAEYNILPKAPEGVVVYSETHPFQSSWYNNNSPVLSWDKNPGVSGFSIELDDKPSTVPKSEINSVDTTKFFENLSDGLWYFHIKAIKSGIWGTAGHFLVRIDTSPPAEFIPEVNYLMASPMVFDRAFVSFFTTDNLSGIDHYEAGVIDKSQPVTESPVFVQTESPFQVPLSPKGDLTVIIRAIDKAGNVRDSSINIVRPSFIGGFIEDYLIYILIAIILIGSLGFVTHYVFGHHIIEKIKRFRDFLKKENKENEKGDGPILPPPSSFTPNP